MKLDIHPSLVEAGKVLEALKQSLELSDLPGSADVLSYGNGRENGYALRFIHKHLVLMFVWAQDRHTDSLVCYSGNSVCFSNTQVPNEEAYSKKVLFPRGDYLGLVDHILTTIRKILLEEAV